MGALCAGAKHRVGVNAHTVAGRINQCDGGTLTAGRSAACDGRPLTIWDELRDKNKAQNSVHGEKWVEESRGGWISLCTFTHLLTCAQRI